MKVVLVGSDPFYKGGIGQYNHFLANALLKKDVELLFIGFSRQYPRFLYPPKGGDRADDSFENAEYKVDRVLSYLNPFSVISAIKKIKKFSPDYVIVPWWTWFWFFHFFSILLFSSSFRRVVIAHNVVSHDKRGFMEFIKNFLSLAIFKRCETIFVQSNEERAILEKEGLSHSFVQYHPIYPQFIPNLSMAEARKRLGFALNEKIVLYFGTIRKYKGPDVFADALKKLPDIKGILAGESWSGDLRDKLLSDSEKYENIIVEDRYLSVEESRCYFAACDAVVLPYRSVTGSGVAMAALAAKKVVVVSNLPLFKEIFPEAVRVVFEKDSAHELAEKIKTIFSDNKLKSGFEFDTILQKFSWERLVENILIQR